MQDNNSGGGEKAYIAAPFSLFLFFPYSGEEEKKKNSLTASHPFVKGLRWESMEMNLLPGTVLSASVRITGYQRSGCRPGRQEYIMGTEWPKP